MTETGKLAIRDAKRAKRNAIRDVKRAKNAKKQHDLEKRTALSPRNITEHVASECARAIKRDRKLHTNALRTDSELLKKVLVSNPAKLEITDTGEVPRYE
jgi:hypothetical protein